MSLFWTIIFLSFAFSKPSESKFHHHQKPSAVVVGTVYCDTCFPKASQLFIAGASVAVECKETSFRREAKTDSHGEFKVHLPFPVSKHVRQIRGCSVKLINSSKPYCAVAASAASSTLHLKSRRDGIHVFSAGFFTFRPLKQPQVCDQKPSINNFKKRKSSDEKLSQISNPNDPAFLPPIQEPPSLGSFLPPLPRLPPLPQLPRLPPLPGIPFMPPIPGIPFMPPIPTKQAPKLTESDMNQPADNFPFPQNPFNVPAVISPNPFQTPPSIVPPVFPSPSSSILPPLFSGPPLFNLPPLFPGLVTSPPPSPSSPPSSPVQLPPFPFQPTAGFPRAPPAEVSSSSETSSP